MVGQIKVYEKSNEIREIPKLIDALLLEGCVITIDSMGFQKSHKLDLKVEGKWRDGAMFNY
jgi:predicted transposase YbfD/YdcC